MSYIVTKMISGHPYLYQVRSERTGNRVRQVYEKYLGRVNQEGENYEFLRSVIYIRDNGICWICHQQVLLEDYELGHLVDRCNGGKLDYNNLVVMHRECNQKKPKHSTLEEHIKWLLETRLIESKYFKKFKNPQGLLIEA